MSDQFHKLALNELGQLMKSTCVGLVKPVAQLKHGGPLTLLMPALGLSLEQMLAIRRSEQTPVTSDELVTFIKKMLNILGILQREGAYHLNLKPSNIFFDGENWALSETMLLSGCLLPHYLSPDIRSPTGEDDSYRIGMEMRRMGPEQAIKRDLYSLAIIVLEVTTLRLPDELLCFRRF